MPGRHRTLYPENITGPETACRPVDSLLSPKYILHAVLAVWNTYEVESVEGVGLALFIRFSTQPTTPRKWTKWEFAMERKRSR